MSKELAGKVAVVTGGGSGQGRASAVLFVREGASVVVSDVNDESGCETVEQIKEGGGEAIFVHADVSDESQVEELMAKTVEVFGGLDFAHNNAGVSELPTTTADMSSELWHRSIGINLTGVFYCMKYEIPRMLGREGAAIVNTGSTASLRGVGGIPAYVASKHGVIGLTKTAAIDYSGTGIRINAVCPGAIDTPLLHEFPVDPVRREAVAADHPIGRFGRSEEVAELVLWLCSSAASFITGGVYTVDGGSSAG